MAEHWEMHIIMLTPLTFSWSLISLAIPGKVYLYDVIADSASFDLATVKSSCILKIDASPTLAPVLTKLAHKYSPVQSTFSFLFF